MIEASARGTWVELEAKLRPFVARRVHDSADVDDVVQEVFLRMLQALAALRDDERFGPWVYRVARNAIVDHHRRRGRVGFASEPVPECASAAVVDDDDGVSQREVATCVAPFVAMLPSPYREALTLSELEGITQREAAAMLGISLSGMKSRVQRGRRLLRKAIEDCCHIALDVRGRVVDWAPRVDGRLPGRCC